MTYARMKKTGRPSIFLAYQSEEEEYDSNENGASNKQNSSSSQKKKKKRGKKKSNENALLKELAMCSLSKKKNHGIKCNSGNTRALDSCENDLKRPSVELKSHEAILSNVDTKDNTINVEATSRADGKEAGHEFFYTPTSIQISRADGKEMRVVQTSDVVNQLLLLSDQNNQLREYQQELQSIIKQHEETIQQLRKDNEIYRQLSTSLQADTSGREGSRQLNQGPSPNIVRNNYSYRAPPPGLQPAF